MEFQPIPRSSTVLIKEPTNYKVSIRFNWTDEFEDVDYLEVIRVTDTVMPTISHAVFRFFYGEIKREDRTDFQVFEALELDDFYVRVRELGETQITRFLGKFRVRDVAVWGQLANIDLGDQEFAAFGLEHLLTQMHITKSHISQDNGELEIERSNRLLDCTERGSLGNALLTDFNDGGAFDHFDGLVRERVFQVRGQLAGLPLAEVGVGGSIVPHNGSGLLLN